ncbi:hypothetical protein J8273_4599 [Carpediemonas membranifera]|uniref:N-acetyltransferase domain-containing protein n=1 Tax=Carpediemonas membranifera TaxID=201153 RepID=A0A8J6DZR1_9EUKA|nr:hypothetical protein J8273_4599 [Carpediemonas membranifera]|eukprot:KAG9393999.1 hypothetical protein J8273_4599 [Carpediemonas membranifera]
MDDVLYSLTLRDTKPQQGHDRDATKHRPDTLLTGSILTLPFENAYIHLSTHLLQTHNTPTQYDLEMKEALVSLYRHILPDMGHKALREYLSNEYYLTFAVLRSVEDVKLDRLRSRRRAEKTPTESDPEEEDTDSEESSESTSSFTGPRSDFGEVLPSDIQGPVDLEDPIKFKDRLVAAISFELVPNTLVPKEKLYQLSLLGVRTRFQQLGLGRRLVVTLKDLIDQTSGDTLIVFAGIDAVPFFSRNGFIEDPILTARYTFMPTWADSSLMISTDTHRPDPIPVSHINSMIEQWKHGWVQQYSREMNVMNSLRDEISSRDRRISEQSAALSLMSEDLTRKNGLLGNMQRELRLAQLEVKRLEMVILEMTQKSKKG